MHVTWRCSVRNSLRTSRQGSGASKWKPVRRRDGDNDGNLPFSSARATSPLPHSLQQQQQQQQPRYGVRNTGRPKLLTVNPRHRQRENQELAEAVQRHNAALRAVTDRSGGALFHGTILDLESSAVGRPLGRIVPGDFVEVQAHQTLRGIALPVNEKSGKLLDERRSAILLPSGEIKFLSLEDTLITFPAFVGADLITQATVNLTVPSDTTRQDQVARVHYDDMEEPLDTKVLAVRAKICAVLRSLLRQSEQQQWKLTRPFVQRYLSSPRDDLTLEQRLFTLTEMAQQLLSDTDMSREQVDRESQSPSTLLAVHTLLVGAPDVFRLDAVNHRSTLTFLMQSAPEQRAFKVVHAMVQKSLELQTRVQSDASLPPISQNGGASDNDPIDAFAQRVKKGVHDRREVYKQLQDTNGPPRIIAKDDIAERPLESPLIHWTKSDKDIIMFLRSSLGIRRSYKTESTVQLVMYIMKACGYELEVVPDSLTDEPGPPVETMATRKALIGRMFREVGLLAPWERLTSFENEFEERIEQPYPKVPDKMVWEADDFMRSEVAETVYVIDEVHAEELDDGLSVVRTSDPEQVWLRIHIADPTSALHPNDNITYAAKQRHSSVYFADRTYPMLPHSFVASISLRPASDGDESQAKRAMTFSAKVDLKSGSVTDMGVTLSYLRDIRVMTYDNATSIMLGTHTDDNRTASDLQLLRDVTGALERRRRLTCGAFYFNQAAHDVIVSPAALPRSTLRRYPDPLSFDTPMYAGFPTIDAQTSRPEGQTIGGPLVTGSRGAVAEAAMTACMVAGQWSAERGVPTLYRGQPGSGDHESLNALLAQRDPNGMVEFGAFARAQLLNEAAILSMQPVEHLSMGVRTAQGMAHVNDGANDVLLTAGYTRITSPLRRFSDMLVHWQLRHALKLEHPKHEPAASPTRYPWTIEELSMLLPRIARMDTWHKTLNRHSPQYWHILKLYRTMLARRLAGVPGGVRTSICGLSTDDGMTALHDSLHDTQAQRTLGEEHTAIVSLGDVRQLPSGEMRVLVMLRNLGITAQLIWPMIGTAGWRTPTIGESFQVRIVDIAWSGSASTVTVKKVEK